MRRTLSIIRVLALACVLWIPGSSEGLSGVSVYAGFLNFDGDLFMDRAPVFGLRWGPQRRIFSGETVVAFSPGEEADVLLYHGDFLLNIPAGETRPYVAVGIGGTKFIPKERDVYGLFVNTRGKWAFNYGGGLRYFLHQRIALRIDVRDHVSFDFGAPEVGSREDLERYKEGQIEAEDFVDTVHTIEMNAGIVVSF